MVERTRVSRPSLTGGVFSIYYYMKKLEKITLTRQDWINALRMPTPIRNKKKYTRKVKHK